MKPYFIGLSALLISLLPLFGEADKPTKQKIAVYDLEGKISESGRAEDSLLNLTMDASRPLTMLDLTRSLEKAAGDTEVTAVVLDTDGAQLDFSQIQQLRRQLLALRAAEKDVWIYSERLDNSSALLGSAANHFTLMPEADCSFTGINAESMYYKGMLDKMGVRADVVHIGDFKSFGENFYRTGPSEYALKQEESLINSIFQQIIGQVAEGRKLTQDAVLKIIDDGSLTAKEVLAAKLADHLMYRTEFVAKLQETYGKGADFDRSYELPDLSGPEITGMMDVFQLMFSSGSKGTHRKDFIAVVTLEGDITDESVAPIRTQILKLAKETKAKALILRVNSPGGSALASEVLWEATDEWNATGKPFVVSMGGVAASGGYYVASAADRIFAEAGTITGSIGVVGMKFVLGEAMEKIGITTHSTQRGKNAGIMSIVRGFSEDESELVKESMTEVYNTFKKRIIDGRGKVLKGDLESLAGGRVYSGEDALKVGLIDQIGGLQEALAYASQEAKLEKVEVKLLPEPKSAFEGLLAPPTEDDDDEIIRATVTASGFQAALKASGILDTLPAATKANVQRLASRLESFQKSRILLLGPDLDLH